jgi:hypothetical protein
MDKEGPHYSRGIRTIMQGDKGHFMRIAKGKLNGKQILSRNVHFKGLVKCVLQKSQLTERLELG